MTIASALMPIIKPVLWLTVSPPSRRGSGALVAGHLTFDIAHRWMAAARLGVCSRALTQREVSMASTAFEITGSMGNIVSDTEVIFPNVLTCVAVACRVGGAFVGAHGSGRHSDHAARLTACGWGSAMRHASTRRSLRT
jgi:hypothetical protein